MQLPDDLRAALASSFFIRTTMARRRSGLPRTVETTYVWRGEHRVVLSGYPGSRDWVANMAAHPAVTLHTVEPSPNGRLYTLPGTARVLRDREERVPNLLAFIERWALRPGFPRHRFQLALAAIRCNRRLRLPWWGPFALVRRILDRMPCVEITVTGPATIVDGPPDLSEPRPGR